MKHINELAPSILSADFTCLGEEMARTEKNGARFLHFDVMDGMFVPNISFGIPVLKSIRKATNQVCDAHLMIEDPIRYVEEFVKAGADYVTVHLEACEDVKDTLQKIHACGAKAGLSIKPGTPVEAMYPFLPFMDLALVMSVEPGFGGQKFMPVALEKIVSLREKIEESSREIYLQVDGGINLDNVEEVLRAGADNIVAGSAIFKGDVEKNTREFMKILQGKGDDGWR